MNGMDFAVLFELLSDRLDLDENKPTNKEFMVRNGALDDGALPVITIESRAEDFLTIALYYPILQEQYRHSVNRQAAARLHLSNLYGARDQVLSGGVASIEDRYYIYLVLDAIRLASGAGDFYPGLYRIMDQMARWLKVCYYPALLSWRRTENCS